jgi:hypothetical protein
VVYWANPRITELKIDIKDLKEEIGNFTLITEVEKSNEALKDVKKTV